MKLASTYLKTFLAAYQTTGAPGNVMVSDLYTVVTGAGRMVLNESHVPSSSAVTVTPPVDRLGINGAFLEDIGVREANGDCLRLVTGTPGSGEYTVASNLYTFADNNAKLISYIYRIGATYGLPLPTIIRWNSSDRNISIFGKTFYSAGTINNGSNPAPALQRSKLRLATGMDVSSLELDLFADPSNQVNNVPILQRISEGFFDGAFVYAQRLVMQDWLVSVGGVLENGLVVMFYGSVADQKCGRASANLVIKARTEVLNTLMPRQLYQAGCRFTLFDIGCRLNPASFFETGIVQTGSNFSVIQTNLTRPGPLPPPAAKPTLGTIALANINSSAAVYFVVITFTGPLGESDVSPQNSISITVNNLLTVSHPPNPGTGATGWNVYVGFTPGEWRLQNSVPLGFSDNWIESPPASGETTGIQFGPAPPLVGSSGWFSGGVITFTSGALSGQSRVISAYGTDHSITVVPALAVSPATSDTFSVLPGCDKLMVTCSGKYNNLINFGGTPFVPSPETAL